MLHAVDEHDLLVFEDLIDDSIIAPPGRVQPLKFSKQRFPEALRVLCDWSLNRCDCCLSHLFWYSVQVSKTFRCDFDFVHQGVPRCCPSMTVFPPDQPPCVIAVAIS